MIPALWFQCYCPSTMVQVVSSKCYGPSDVVPISFTFLAGLVLLCHPIPIVKFYPFTIQKTRPHYQTRSPGTLCRAVFLFLCILNVVVILYYIFYKCSTSMAFA